MPKAPGLAGLLYDRLVSEIADLRFSGRIGAVFSGPEIPFRGNGDRGRQRLGSNGDLLPRKPEHLVLGGPFGRQVGEAGRTVYPPKCDVERTVSATRPAMTRPLVCTENLYSDGMVM